MKLLCLAVSLVSILSASAIAAEKVAQPFIALECNGRDRPLQFLDLSEWRWAGDTIPDPGGAIDDFLKDLEVRVRAISIYEADALKSAKTSDAVKAEFVESAIIDAYSLGLPEKIKECKVFPIAMTAKDIRSGAGNVISRVVYDRLAPLDQFVFRALYRGINPGIVRTLLNAKGVGDTFYERYQYYSAQGFKTMSVGGMEIAIGKNDRPTFEDSRLIRASPANSRIAQYITFTPEGQVRYVYGNYSGANVRLRLQPGEDFTSNEGPRCETAVYRRDGTLALCGSKFFSPEGIMLGIADKAVHLQAGSYDGSLFERARDFILNDTYGKDGVIQWENVSKDIKKMEVFLSEPSCGTLSLNSSPGRTAGTFNLSVHIPAYCTALVRLR